MFNEVRNLINNTNIEEFDITDAFNYLLNHQFVFRNNTKDRKHYAFINEHLELFRKGFLLFGMTMIQNNDYGYIGLSNTSSTEYNRLSMIDTAILVTLRIIYHQEKESRSNEDGSITVSGSHLIAQYKQYTERNDLDESKSKFIERLKLFKQKRILSLSSELDEETNLPMVTICPTIEVILTPEVAKKMNFDISQRSKSINPTKEPDFIDSGADSMEGEE